ncbi:CBS domain containing-hemolysin-like protein [Stackebrandtia endophytica]|uniref:CBS domain containing-hemolysin-like protein n=1 Tax=Stackebrandtia endophytica TaxID=1496996 RepID=A0A543AYY3_9ACTN|nr:hemolysin family protein [Stackebrandtia endophytica]TQL77783.1 CBS domain containing-hemolysin-like protein [Stackebrandtia endophytica]
MSTTWALIISFWLLVFNAFFVAAEFALLASKRHRLEAMASSGSRAAKAALHGTRELTLMLAGAQLGITVCTVGLGALAEPALAHLLDPWFLDMGIPPQASYPIAFLIALIVVVFLHMVIGEMAPKSWAISHPETSAVMLALPFRGYARLLRPLLLALNGMANVLLRMFGVTPQDTAAQAHGPDELRILLRESREQGYLPEQQHQMLSGALRVQSTTVGDVMVPRADMVTTPVTADLEAIERISRESGRSRLVVVDGEEPVGMVHIRDVVRAEGDAIASSLMWAPLNLPIDQTVAGAVTTMRQQRAQLALVADGTRTVGLVALEDLLEEIIGEFEDETDRP